MPRALLALLAAALVVHGGETRFGRQVLAPADPERYGTGKLDQVSAPTLSDEHHTVTCLTYADDERFYVEVTIKNRSRAEVNFGPASIRLDEDGKPLPRVDSIKEARRVESNGARPFEPVPKGVDPKTRRPIYDRDEVDRQATLHLERQEREAVFASLLLSMGRENGSIVKTGYDKHVVCAFGPRKAKSAPVEVTVEAGGTLYRFVFKP